MADELDSAGAVASKTEIKKTMSMVDGGMLIGSIDIVMGEVNP